MSLHLESCLKDNLIRHFPCKKQCVKSHIRKTEKIEIFCSCRLSESGRMILCDDCSQWYHDSCSDIDGDVDHRLFKLLLLNKALFF